MSTTINQLNLSGTEFCGYVGIKYHADIMKWLRELHLVGFFKIGKKYMYHAEDVKKVSDMLRKGEISIKTNNGYYITLNDKSRRTINSSFS